MDAFGERLRERVEKFRVGSGMEASTTHGPLINKASVEKVRSHVHDALDNGAKLLTGGKESENMHGYFYPPTVLTDMKNNMRIATEETFGPVAGIFKFDTEEEVLEYANNTRFGLAGYFFSKDVSRCWRVAESLQVGMVGVNTGAISSEVAPFGGVSRFHFGSC
jgi:succinate-semialdehyde dehydrogenase/glutarate-semialdehyde dehydrogenase